MRGVCTCLHLGMQVQKKQEGGVTGRGIKEAVQGTERKREERGGRIANRKHSQLRISDRDTTTQHQVMLPKKTAT